jgi:hypothetical protein
MLKKAVITREGNTVTIAYECTCEVHGEHKGEEKFDVSQDPMDFLVFMGTMSSILLELDEEAPNHLPMAGANTKPH